MEDVAPTENVNKQKLLRCVDWLQKQNEEPTKLSLQNKNDIQFIIQTNAARKSFLLAAAEDEATVPAGVDEISIEPMVVSLHKLRVANLNMECEWQSCRKTFSDYEMYQEHVKAHASKVHVIETENGVEYVCLWDVCGHKTSDFKEMIRHMSYHAYHGKLLAIGYNGRATLKVPRCNKDSTKRNLIPDQNSEYRCMWFECEEKYNAIQNFFDHVKLHVNYAEPVVCSWAGCGATFSKKGLLVVHVRSHTTERLIACYHCGYHFANNRKFGDHLRRQNVHRESPWVCSLCCSRLGSASMLAAHERAHVSTFACTLCDMSAPSPAALANHVRYRHVRDRPHGCPHPDCTYRAVKQWDLSQHMKTHNKKKAQQIKDDLSDDENSESESRIPTRKRKLNSESEDTDVKHFKKKKSNRMYACHMCPTKEMKVFSRGSRLTIHLVKAHGAQWSFGHHRFRYQLCEDGRYRLTTTRYESLEVSKKIVDDYTGPKEFVSNFEFNIKQVAEPTETTPRSYEVNWSLPTEEINKCIDNIEDKKVEITMCDVDDSGNIISSKIIKSEFVYT